jgi:hypothetical protein
MIPDYDTEEGIRTYLTDLDGVHRLFKARHQAGYDRHERLREFLVLGRYYLDTCGNCMLTTFKFGYDVDANFLCDGFDPVVPWADVVKIPKLRSTSTFEYPPTAQHVCEECGEGWTITNMHDSERVRNHEDDTFRYEHLACYKLSAERRMMAFYREVLDEAGYGMWLSTPIPNEYWPDDAPWCLVRGPKGSLKIGWRKRVLNIDWAGLNQGAKLDADKLFPGENVTKGDTYIHAWGKEKAVEYLRVLLAVLKAP